MNFSEFITAINNCFLNFFTHINDIISPILQNNFIKLIICISLFSFIIYLLFEVFEILFTIFNNRHDKKEELKLINGETEKNKEKKGKNGDNFKKKDIYW